MPIQPCKIEDHLFLTSIGFTNITKLISPNQENRQLVKLPRGGTRPRQQSMHVIPPAASEGRRFRGRGADSLILATLVSSERDEKLMVSGYWLQVPFGSSGYGFLYTHIRH